VKIRDTEDLLQSIRAHVKSSLNAKITAINTEKDDDYELETIPADDDHYVFAGELLDLPNHAFVNFSITELLPTQARGNLAINPTMMIEVAFDNPKKAGTMFMSLRYMRAIYEALMDYQADEVDDLQITLAQPMLVALTGRQLIVSGVGITCGISN
jgi:hypothetical protein